MQSIQRAFTLVELLVVIAIIAVLAGLLLPALAQAKAKAAQSRCGLTTRQHSIAVMMYAQDFQDVLPPVEIPVGDKTKLWPELLQPYLQAAKIHICPSDRLSKKVSYGLNELIFVDFGDEGVSTTTKEGDIVNPPLKVMLGELGTEKDFKTPRPDTFKLIAPSGDINDESDARPDVRHNQRCSIGFMDGHMESLTIRQFYTNQSPVDRFFAPRQ